MWRLCGRTQDEFWKLFHVYLSVYFAVTCGIFYIYVLQHFDLKCSLNLIFTYGFPVWIICQWLKMQYQCPLLILCYCLSLPSNCLVLNIVRGCAAGWCMFTVVLSPDELTPWMTLNCHVIPKVTLVVHFGMCDLKPSVCDIRNIATPFVFWFPFALTLFLLLCF